MRTDDGWTDWPELVDLSLAARWHYLAVVHMCSRTKHYDGILRRVDALRASDIDDPAAALAELADSGLVADSGRHIAVVRIEQHVPPPHLRDDERKAAQRERKRRERAHKAGEHYYCNPDACDVAANVTRDSPRDNGTGRAGQSRAGSPRREQAPINSSEDDRRTNTATLYVCRVCGQPGVPAGESVHSHCAEGSDGCAWCSASVAHPGKAYCDRCFPLAVATAPKLSRAGRPLLFADLLSLLAEADDDVADRLSLLADDSRGVERRSDEAAAILRPTLLRVVA
ncbi:hypothetical protein [Gordonia alkanivorans]|uniref:hypothetical protein n=1 Tax=Gordonia alkanivorans TaxID=84096 RepID=UPI002446BB91|nr:hypothetical protein [Gordonia alkanivorans]MDH3014003.1 hypothetical protein [Gordonia alkanivorans]